MTREGGRGEIISSSRTLHSSTIREAARRAMSTRRLLWSIQALQRGATAGSILRVI